MSCVIDSHVVGVAKPDPRIFEPALAALGLPASARIAYVGDTVFFRRIAETKIVSDWRGQKMNAGFGGASASTTAKLRRMVSKLSSTVKPH